MKALILAAGLGNRLGELTSDRPKAMIRVGEKELLLRVFDFLDNPAVSSKAVVTGYKADVLTGFIKKYSPETKIFHNPDFRKGSILTLKTALDFLDDDFLLLNVDHIYPKRMLPHILKQCSGVSAICDFDRTLGEDDMKVKLGTDSKLKGIRKTLSEYDCGYIGMTFCDRDNIEKYRRAVLETGEIHGEQASVEWVLGHLADKGERINICDASGMGWLEVDTQTDLESANKILNQNRNFLA